MGKKADVYRATLAALDEWEPYLLAESGLPGPRGNLELVQAAADVGDEARFTHFLAAYGPEDAPTNTPGELVAVCGVVGLGRLMAEGRLDLMERVRACANDPRWRMREGVAMALQRLGERDMGRLLDEMAGWVGGTLLERRAAAAGLCEPHLLREARHARQTLALLDAITGSVGREEDRRSEDFKALRKGLGYAWSVAVAALPEAGKPLMEKWLDSPDKDIRWIMKQNLRKARIGRMDAEWAANCLARLG
jgi:hypothetical protein